MIAHFEFALPLVSERKTSQLESNSTESAPMKCACLVYIIGCGVSLHLRKQSAARGQDKAEEPERPMLFLTQRELWASGFDAKKNPAHISSNSSALFWHTLVWTQETVDTFRDMYDEAMNPMVCTEADDITIAEKPYWGLTSRIRDFQDILIGRAFNGTLVLHRHGGLGCSDESPKNPDPFMRCIFEPFSRCQNETALHPSHPVLSRLVPVEDDPGRFLQPLLEVLRGAGLSESGLSGSGLEETGEPVGYQHLGVIRSLLQTTAFKFSPIVEKRVAELESTFGSIDAPMLVVHIRRTDKVTDSSSMPQWFNVSGLVSPMQSLKIILKLIEFAESKMGQQYRSLYLISDDPRFYELEYRNVLQNATSGKATILYNPYITGAFGGDSTWLKNGHTSRSGNDHNALDVQLGADMSFAIKHGSHIVGCGRSGISQFIAQGLGAKYMVDPNALSLFEDDSLLVQEIMGRQEAEKHLRLLSLIWSFSGNGSTLATEIV